MDNLFHAPIETFDLCFNRFKILKEIKYSVIDIKLRNILKLFEDNENVVPVWSCSGHPRIKRYHGYILFVAKNEIGENILRRSFLETKLKNPIEDFNIEYDLSNLFGFDWPFVPVMIYRWRITKPKDLNAHLDSLYVAINSNLK